MLKVKWYSRLIQSQSQVHCTQVRGFSYTSINLLSWILSLISPFSQIPAFRILQVPFRVLQIPAVRDLHILFRVLQIPSFTDSAIYIFHSIPQFTDSIPFREIQTPIHLCLNASLRQHCLRQHCLRQHCLRYHCVLWYFIFILFIVIIHCAITWIVWHCVLYIVLFLYSVCLLVVCCYSNTNTAVRKNDLRFIYIYK